MPKLFAVDDDPICLSSEVRDASGSNTFHTKFLCRNTVLPGLLLQYAWQNARDRMRYQTLVPASPKAQVQRGPQNPDGGPILLIIWGPTGPQNFLTAVLTGFKTDFELIQDNGNRYPAGGQVSDNT